MKILASYISKIKSLIRLILLRSVLIITPTILLSTTVLADIPTTVLPPISHVSTSLVDVTGRVVILHGLSIMQKQSPFYLTEFYNSDGMGGTLGEDWAKFYADNGFNLARVGISWAAVEPTPGNYDDSYILKIRDMTRMFNKYGVYVLLDFHQDGWSASFNGDMFPEWAANTILNGVPQVNSNFPFPNSVWENPAVRAIWDNFWNNIPAVNDNIGVQDRYINMYGHVVQFFKYEPNILAFESLNEPSPDINTWICIGSPTLAQYRFLPGDILSSCPSFFQTTYFQFKERLNAKIKSIDPIHMIADEPSFYEIMLPKIPIVPAPSNTKILMARQAYRSIANPNNTLALQQSQAIAKSNNTGFIINEFGATIDALSSLPSIAAFYDQSQISWAYFSFEQGFDVRTATDNQSIIINRTLPPTDSNIDLPRLQALVEPYPRVIAGTPISYQYDPIANAFNMSYSKIGANGKEVLFLLPTEIYVPNRNYPNGYNVKVTGAYVISKPNASVLLLIRNSFYSTVSVSITSK